MIQRSITFELDDLAAIDQLAQQHKLSRSKFLVAAALERLPPHMSRLDELEQRLQRLEERVDLAY